MEADVQTLQRWIDESRAIVFFGGAGVSTESGIPDFRSVDGLYNQKYAYPPEEILSHTFFKGKTEEFYRFYRDKMLCLTAQPNAAHRKRCGKSYSAQWVLSGTGVPKCDCGGVVKPDVVLYEEQLDSDVIEGAVNDIRKADLLIVGGTSLAVYPAAGLINYYRGSRLVLINKSETPRDRDADLVLHGPIGQILGQIKVKPL